MESFEIKEELIIDDVVKTELSEAEMTFKNSGLQPTVFVNQIKTEIKTEPDQIRNPIEIEEPKGIEP
jgi:hypothetical protein